jgi:hypothetical protein
MLKNLLTTYDFKSGGTPSGPEIVDAVRPQSIPSNFPKLGDFARVRAKSYLVPSSNCERARSQKSPFISNMR